MDREPLKESFYFFLFLMIAALIIGILTGCDTVEIKERVVYESDGSPVKNAKVRHWNETYKGGTITNENGEWTMTVPTDVFINLCIENPRNNNIEACYENGYLLTPEVGSGVTELKDIPK